MGARCPLGLRRGNNHTEERTMTNGAETTVTRGVRESVTEEEFEALEVEIDECEPWAEWETKLVTYSIGLGIAGLVVMGVLVNAFIL